MTQIVDHDQIMDTMGETPKLTLKIQDLLLQLNFIEIAGVIHCASEALRHSCGFARCYADLGVTIKLFDNGEDDWIRDDIADVREQKELVSLISAASFKLQTLIK